MIFLSIQVIILPTYTFAKEKLPYPLSKKSIKEFQIQSSFCQVFMSEIPSFSMVSELLKIGSDDRLNE